MPSISQKDFLDQSYAVIKKNYLCRQKGGTHPT